MEIDKIINSFSVAFCIVDPSDEIVISNTEFQSLTGYEQGKIDLFFYNKEEAEKFKERIRREKERVTQEIFLSTKDKRGVLVNLSALARRDKDGNLIDYALSIFDLSNIKEFQATLEKKVREKTQEIDDFRAALLNMTEEADEARHRSEKEKDKTMAIINDFTDGLILFDKNDLIDIVNPKAEKFLEIKAEDVIGLKIEDLEYQEHLKPLIESLTKPEEEDERREIEVIEGQTLEVSVIPIITQEESMGTLVALHDITREKMVEAMKSEFVSIAAHQLRTPLSAIKWTTKMLLDGDMGDLNEGQKELTEKAYASNERMVSLINDLLNVSRIEEGRLSLQARDE